MKDTGKLTLKNLRKNWVKNCRKQKINWKIEVLLRVLLQGVEFDVKKRELHTVRRRVVVQLHETQAHSAGYYEHLNQVHLYKQLTCIIM